MNKDGRRRRDLQIAIEAVSGLSQSEIAERHGISERTVRRAIGRIEGASPDSAEGRAYDEFSHYWLYLGQAIEDLGFLRTNASTVRGRVTAIDRQAALMTKRIEVLQALGVVPSSTTLTEDEAREAAISELGGVLLASAREQGLGADVERWLERQLYAFGGAK